MPFGLPDYFTLRRQVRDVLSGKTEAIGNVTITTGATTTTVSAQGCNTKSHVTLMPTDATTALEYGLGTTYVTPGDDQFVITHPSNGNTRIYRWTTHFGIRS